jgi:hypothetical protein
MWRIRRRSWMFLVAGLVIGLAIGGAMTAGTVIGMRAGSGHAAALDELKLRASASSGAETFAIATGQIDGEVEGLFCLDYLTGDLSCFVISPRNPRQFAGLFKTNIVKELPPEKGKKPAYVMVTGGINIRGPNAPSSVVYVADANSGAWAAYSFAWVKSASSAGLTQAQPMVTIAAGKARELTLRE